MRRRRCLLVRANPTRHSSPQPLLASASPARARLTPTQAYPPNPARGPLGPQLDALGAVAHAAGAGHVLTDTAYLWARTSSFSFPPAGYAAIAQVV